MSSDKLSKCSHCPLAEFADRPCPGERDAAVCERADVTSPKHRPGILQKLASFAGAIVQHVAAGMPMASEEQKAARLAICVGCEHYNNGSCSICGCGLATKAGWAGQSCPLAKWLAVAPTPVEPVTVEPAHV